MSKLRAHPDSPGINQKKIKHARDPNLYSVRIDQVYCGPKRSVYPVKISTFPPQFYADEWSKVIHAQEITTLSEYARATRRGRGVRLHRAQRIAVWRVFEEFHNVCDECRVRNIETAMHEARQIIEARDGEPLYTSVIVDDDQDLSSSAYRLLRAIAGNERANDLFIVGDAHQRIYRNRAVLSHCGINVRGRSSYLRMNYRTTEEIRTWAFSLNGPLTDLDTKA